MGYLIVPLLALLVAATEVASSRETPECSLNGDKDPISGLCRCDLPWTGPVCATLEVLPVSFPQGYGMQPNQTTWGGDIHTVDNKGFHLFVSVMTNNCSLRSWTTHSRIEHVVADTITGPYQFKGVALPTFSHNPKVITLKDGSLALIHVGDGTGPDEGGKCKGPHDHDVAVFPRNLEDKPKGSNIHIAPSVYGPWTPLINSTLPPCNNPAPFAHHASANENIPTAIYIVCKPGRNHTILYRSTEIWGPWENLGQITPFPEDDNTQNKDSSSLVYEDPSLYIDGRGFHLIFHLYDTAENPPHGHDCTHSTISAHLFSQDGKQWHRSPGQPFGNHIELESGETILVATRERPSLVIGENSATGDPQLTHLITATCSAIRCPEGPPPGCVDCKYDYWDYTLIQPLKV